MKKVSVAFLALIVEELTPHCNHVVANKWSYLISHLQNDAPDPAFDTVSQCHLIRQMIL